MLHRFPIILTTSRCYGHVLVSIAVVRSLAAVGHIPPTMLCVNVTVRSLGMLLVPFVIVKPPAPSASIVCQPVQLPPPGLHNCATTWSPRAYPTRVTEACQVELSTFRHAYPFMNCRGTQVGVAVAVGVFTGVWVKVGVFVIVGVSVIVLVGVIVRVGVRVRVRVAVGAVPVGVEVGTSVGQVCTPGEVLSGPGIVDDPENCTDPVPRNGTAPNSKTCLYSIVTSTLSRPPTVTGSAEKVNIPGACRFGGRSLRITSSRPAKPLHACCSGLSVSQRAPMLAACTTSRCSAYARAISTTPTSSGTSRKKSIRANSIVACPCWGELLRCCSVLLSLIAGLHNANRARLTAFSACSKYRRCQR
jgi:hypothetical protein